MEKSDMNENEKDPTVDKHELDLGESQKAIDPFAVADTIADIAIANNAERYFFRTSATDFKKIPGNPIAFWVSDSGFDLFRHSQNIGDFVKPRQGMSTNDNFRFLRRWFEVSLNQTGFNLNSSQDAKASRKKWFPYNKGGEYRKWQGNFEYLVNWGNNGEEIKQWLVTNPKDPNTTHWSRRIINTEFYFKKGLTWSFVSSSKFGIRYTPKGFLFDVGGSSMFPSADEIYPMLGFLCSNKRCCKAVNFQVDKEFYDHKMA